MLTRLQKQWKAYAAVQLKAVTAPVYRRAPQLNTGALCMPESEIQQAVFESLGLPSMRQCIQDVANETQHYLDYQDTLHVRYLGTYLGMENVLKRTLTPVLQAHEAFESHYGQPVTASLYTTTKIPYYPMTDSGASKPYIVLEALADGLFRNNPDTIRGVASNWLKAIVADGRITQNATFEEFLYPVRLSPASEVLHGQDGAHLLNEMMSSSKHALLTEAIRTRSVWKPLNDRRQGVKDALARIQSRTFTKDTVEDLNKQIADYAAMTFGIMAVADIMTHVGRAVYESAYAIHSAEVEYDRNNNK